MKDFFISYQAQDLGHARWVDEVLRAAGYSTIFQDRDFRSGNSFVLAIDEAMRDSHRVIALLSPSYLESAWTRAEWAAAMARSTARQDGSLLPVRVGPVHDLGLLSGIAFIDLLAKDDEAARNALVAGVGGGAVSPAGLPGMAMRFPGAARRLLMLPHLRNAFFVGRQALIEALRQRHAAARGATVIDALVGLGGVGKSQVALEFAHRHAGDYQAVLWINAFDAAALSTGFAAAARRLGLEVPQSQVDLEELAARVSDRLAAQPGWLMVLDNVEAPDLVRPLIPRAAGGHVLLTSRNTQLASLGVAQPHVVPDLGIEDSVTFLRQRANRSADSESAAESAALVALAQALGGLPLALEQAGAYVAATQAAFGTYLDEFQRSRLDLLEQQKVQASPYEGTVGTTWRLSLAQVETASPAAADLLRASAFLAPDPIPLRMIAQAASSQRFSLATIFEAIILAPEDRQHSHVLGPHLKQALHDVAEAPLRAFSLLEPLLRYSLVRLDAARECYSMHRVLQEVVREAVGPDGRKLWVRRGLEMLNIALPASGLARATDEVLLPHARAVIALARVLAPDDADLPLLMERLGGTLLDLSGYRGARSWLEEAARSTERRHGQSDARLAVALHNLGVACRELGDLPAAESALRRALAIRQTDAAADPVAMAKTQDALGNVLVRAGRAAHAEALHRSALATYEALVPPQPSLVATGCQFLCDCLTHLDRRDEARGCLQRSLGISRNVRPLPQRDIAIGLYNLARLDDDLAAALGHLSEARELFVALFGAGNLWVARVDGARAEHLLAAGDPTQADPLFCTCVPVLEETLGTRHLEVGITLSHWAEAKRLLGRLDDQFKLLERAHAIAVHACGATSANALQCLVGLVDNAHRQGLHAQGLPLADALVAGLEQVAPGSAEHGAALTYRGAMLFGLRRFAQAREANEMALAIQLALPAPVPGDRSVSMNNIANALRFEGRSAEAEVHYRRALDLFAEEAPDHPMRTACRDNFASLLRAAGRGAEADGLVA